MPCFALLGLERCTTATQTTAGECDAQIERAQATTTAHTAAHNTACAREKERTSDVMQDLAIDTGASGCVADAKTSP